MFRYKTIYKKSLPLSLIFLLSLVIFLTSLNYVFYYHLPFEVCANVYDPSLFWKTLDSKYCTIIFPLAVLDKHTTQYKEIAIHIAEIVDEIYPQITLQFGKPFQSHKKFTIILEDFSDSTYGFATTIPHPLIRINLTAPDFNIFDTKFESWLRILIAHEYTHLAHFDMTDKITTFMRLFLGQIIAPNALQPAWSIEGLAIYNESKLTSGGRLQDSRYEMYLRADFLENQVKKLEQIEGDYLVSWPGGNAPYIYGQSLVHFISNEFGEENLIKISRIFSSLPFLGMNWSLKKVIGIGMDELFQKWKNEKKRQYEQQIDEIINYSNITQSQQITNNHYWVSNPIWLTDKEFQNPILFYKCFTPELYPSIRRYDLNSGVESILIKRTSGHGSSYSLSPDKQYLLYSKLIQYSQYYNYYDLFLYHFNTGKQYQVTEKMRIKDPAWHPDSSTGKIAAVINKAGTNNLVLISFNDLSKLKDKHNLDELTSLSNLVFLTDFNDSTQISQPVWSPKGDMIALSIWHQGYQDIYIITLDEQNIIKSIKPITLDHYTDINPNWSPDGQYLLFSSDRSSVFNLYAYSLSDNQFYRLTNVVTGIFEPAVSPDGNKIAFIQYHSSGYELHLAEISHLLWKLIDKPRKNLSANYPAIKDNKIVFLKTLENKNDEDDQLNTSGFSSNLYSSYSFKDYSPQDSIMPTYWIPYASISDKNLYLGFSTTAQDYLKFYEMPITIAYNLFNDSLFYDFQHLNYSNKPVFSFSWQGETSSFSELQLSLRFTDSGYTSVQDSGRFYSRSINIGIQNKYFLDINNHLDKGRNGDTKVLNSLILKYNYSDAERYTASIGPQIGNSFSLNYQYAPASLNNNRYFHKILFDGRKYFPLSLKNQVLALRLVAGFVSNDLDYKAKFNLGGNFAAPSLSSTKTDSFSLRGFPDSSFIGNHLLLTSLEYRFPLKMVEGKIGFQWASVFLEQVSGKIFLDAGDVWDKKILPAIKDLNISIGAELEFVFKHRYSEQLVLSLGIGKAITESLPSRFYGRMGFSF